MEVSAMHNAVETVKAWVFPLSAAMLFCVYPLVILVWTILEGRAAGQVAKDSVKHQEASSSKPVAFQDACDMKPVKRNPVLLSKRFRGLKLTGFLSRPNALVGAVALAGLGSGTLAFTGKALSFVMASLSRQAVQRTPSAPQLRSEEGAAAAQHQHQRHHSEAHVATPAFKALAFGGTVAALWYSYCHWAIGSSKVMRPSKSKLKRNHSAVLRACFNNSEVVRTQCELPSLKTPMAEPAGVPVYTPPLDGISMWHHVDLNVKTWLDEDTGLFHYVNEIPSGALQKFELQTKLENNVIREDEKGSSRLKSFGQPVPFNYGCFPQTYRDPQETDDVYGAPGDDDPLDVLDLSPEAAGVGEVVSCRALGAVCLIDEGQADWKIIVVNTNSKGPLAQARSIEEAERIAPGRIQEALRWMDDFKQHRGNGESVLHFEIHGADRALSIIQKDHAAWKRLVAKVDASGKVHGHWIHAAEKADTPPQAPQQNAAWHPKEQRLPTLAPIPTVALQSQYQHAPVGAVAMLQWAPGWLPSGFSMQ